MSKKDERIKNMIELLQRRKGMTVKELATYFDVSEMTIRRDMKFLKDNQLMLDIPGAAVLNPNSSNAVVSDNYSIVTATITQAREKERIGKYAASLIENDDCVIIDNGTTTERLASSIPGQLRATVLTSNLNIVNQLAHKPNISIILAGGYYHPDTGMFESQESIALIRKTRATKVFCSAAGIHETMGVTCMNNYELETKWAIMGSGAQKILLADSSKFGFVKSCYIGDIEFFDMIITDDKLSDEWKEIIRSKGVELVIV